MNVSQLRGDLKLIEEAINRSDSPQSTKRLLGELVEWNRGLIDQVGPRIESLDDAVDELLDGVEEGISAETAQVILIALEQSGHVCATIAAFLESDKNELDDVTTRSFEQLVKNCAQSVAAAREVVAEVVIAEERSSSGEGEEEDPDDEDVGTEEETR